MTGLIVTPGDIQDRDVASTLLTMACCLFPSIIKGLGDGGYQGTATAQEVFDDAGIPLEIVKRSDGKRGFMFCRNAGLSSAHSAGLAAAGALPKTLKISGAPIRLLSQWP